MGGNSDKRTSALVVNEQVDKRVNSLSLSLTFVALGIALTLFPSFLGNPMATTVAQWAFIALGVCGFLSSFGDKDSEIKGSGNIGAGILVLAIGFGLFTWVPAPWNGATSIAFFLFGLYGVIRGILFLLITSWKSFRRSNRTQDASKGFFIVVESATKLAALAMVILQMVHLQT